MSCNLDQQVTIIFIVQIKDQGSSSLTHLFECKTVERVLTESK